MSDLKEENFKSVSIEEKNDKTDNYLNNTENNNQNENSIDPSQDIKASDTISTNEVTYTKSPSMSKKKN